MISIQIFFFNCYQSFQIVIVSIDNHISLSNYYCIAHNLLRQASIYREKKNVVELRVARFILFSEFDFETIPFHCRDYQALLPQKRLRSGKVKYPSTCFVLGAC
ncbi:hypothetical protein HID58_038183, partial [Brassica napus]